MNFTGQDNKCRVHGGCLGNDVSPGRVARVGGNDSHYVIIRNFVSCLSCLALGTARPNGKRPGKGNPSCVILGSIDGMNGTVPILGRCGDTLYLLSGSSTKERTFRRVTRTKYPIESGSSYCQRCGSLGSCLLNEGVTRRGGASRRRRATPGLVRGPTGGRSN